MTVFHRHAINNTVMVVQLNHGFVEIGMNMVTSLKRIDKNLPKRVVIWATTNLTAKSLERYQKDMGFGIYAHHPVLSMGASSESLEPGGTIQYYEMMRSRARFFLYILQDLGMGMFFVDGDIVFLKDPWPFVVGNHGLGVIPPSLDDPYGTIQPDIVYSTDASGPLDKSLFPFQSFYAIIPKVCGGLFYARPTANTIKIYHDLEYAILSNQDANDQWTMDDLLADGRPVLLTGPLTNGLCRRYTPCFVSKDTLRIRILDQKMFQNGGTAQRLRGELDAKNTTVSIHANFWPVNKTDWMVKMGVWYL